MVNWFHLKVNFSEVKYQILASLCLAREIPSFTHLKKLLEFLQSLLSNFLHIGSNIKSLKVLRLLGAEIVPLLRELRLAISYKENGFSFLLSAEFIYSLMVLANLSSLVHFGESGFDLNLAFHRWVDTPVPLASG